MGIGDEECAVRSKGENDLRNAESPEELGLDATGQDARLVLVQLEDGKRTE
jgi:hypothetical protein